MTLPPWTREHYQRVASRVRRFGMSDIVVRCRRPLAIPPPGGRRLRRSVRLFRAFLVEQTDPARFYGALARDAALHIGHVHRSRRCGSSSTSAAVRATSPRRSSSGGATYRSVDSDVGEMAMVAEPRAGQRDRLGDGVAVRRRSVDVCYSSNVLEHVAEPWLMADEMVRVTRPGGLVFVSYTTWYGPWGGHETAPWHFLGGRYAAQALRRASTAGARRTTSADRCSPSPSRPGCATPTRSAMPRSSTCCRATTRGGPLAAAVPGLRELVTWNLVIVLRRDDDASPLARGAAGACSPQRAVRSMRHWSGGCAALTRALVLFALRLRAGAGRVVSDTKLDLTQAPWRFLGRALQMWDPAGSAVRCRTRPTATCSRSARSSPLGDALGLPAWVVQRLWWGVVLSVAFLGVTTLLAAVDRHAGTAAARRDRVRGVPADDVDHRAGVGRGMADGAGAVGGDAARRRGEDGRFRRPAMRVGAGGRADGRGQRRARASPRSSPRRPTC